MTESVHVVDDDPQALRAVTALVRSMGVDVFGYGSAEEFLDLYDGRRPACLVTDVRMKGLSGLELQMQLRDQGRDLAVIVLTAFATPSSAVRAMQNGAVTLLEKPCPDDQLWEAIRRSLDSDRDVFARRQQWLEVKQCYDSLTAKEREVLACIAAGDANKVAAKKLGVSVRTIEDHRRAVFQKMGVDSLAELVRRVVQLESRDVPAPL
jgi:FixJ family two-component response regulator